MLRRKVWFKTWNETRHEPGKGNGVSARPCEGMKGTSEACLGEESDYPNLGMREYCGIPPSLTLLPEPLLTQSLLLLTCLLYTHTAPFQSP